MSENREPYITDSATQLAAELLRRGNLLGCDTATVLLAAAVERLQGELAEARKDAALFRAISFRLERQLVWALAEVERVRDQERRAIVKYLELEADLALTVDRPIAARALQAIAYEIKAGFHAMIDA